MGELMTKHMWHERSQEIHSDTKKFVAQIVERYKAAYSYCILQELRNNLSGRNEQKFLLEQRKWQNYNRPLHSGALYVVGSIDHRKWRRRYCVLQPDYTLEVYDSKEDFDAANRPRYSRKFSSFEVVDNVDAHLNQLIKDYLRDFGYVRENVSDVVKKVGTLTDTSKKPTQHVLALYHKYRGTFYMAADSAVEKDKWLKIMQDAQRQLAGVHCESQLQQDAFELAIRQACDAEEHCALSVNISGTQEEITADFITDYLSNGCKTMLQTKVKGDVYKKYRMWSTISKTLAESVESIVKDDYPPLRQKAESEAEEMRQKMLSAMPQISLAYETACSEIIADFNPTLRDHLEMKILPKILDMVTRMGDSMSSCLREVRDVFISLAENVQRQVTTTSSEFANNIDRFFLSHLDIAPRNPEVMQNTFQAVVGKKAPFAVLSETFPKLQYSQYEARLCVLLQKLLDSAICTFEVLCGEAVSKNKGHLQAAAVAKIEGRVLKKLSHDSGVLTKQFLSNMTREITFSILRHIIYHDSKNKFRDYEDFVPSEFATFMPVANLHRDAVYSKLDEELQPCLAAAFKRLAHDHFNMVRYHSSSTINSHSSNTSDGFPAKQESSQTTPTQKTPSENVAQKINSRKEDTYEEIPNETEVPNSVENFVAAEASCDAGAGYIMDGETGECLEQVDENGEAAGIENGDNINREGEKGGKEIRQNEIKDAKVITEDEMLPQESFTKNSSADKSEVGEASIEQKGNYEEVNNKEEESSVVVESPTSGRAAAKARVTDDAENEKCTKDPILSEENPTTEKDADEDKGKDVSLIQEKEELMTSENYEVGEEVCEMGPLKDAQTDDVIISYLTGESEMQAKGVNSTEPEVVDSSEKSKILKHEENEAGSDEIENSGTREDLEQSPSEGDESGNEDEEMDDAQNDGGTGPVVETSFSKQDEIAFKQPNGELEWRMENSHSDPPVDSAREMPPVPARKKKHQPTEKQATKEHGDNSKNDIQPQGRPLDNDLEKYNGVVEQIIHTGEEKLI